MTFDTLAYARRLKSAGMPDAQAEAVAEATRDLIASDTATKSDIADLKHEIGIVRPEIGDVRRDLTAEITALRADLTHEIAAVRAEITAMGMRVTVRLGTLIAVGVAILAAIINSSHLPPASPNALKSANFFQSGLRT